MKKCLLALATLFALTMSSCNDSSGVDEVTTQTLTGYFNYVTDLTTNQSTITTGVTYTVDYNYSTSKADIVVNNLRLPNGADYPGLTFSGVKWEYNKAWKDVYKASAVPTAINFYNVPTFIDFKFNLLDEYISTSGSETSDYIPHTAISFTVSDYYIISRPVAPIFTASTTVKANNATGMSTTSTNPIYVFDLDLEDMVLAIAVNNFVLADGSSMNAVALKKIPFTIDGEVINFARDNFKSEMIGNSSDDYKYEVSGLKGSYDFKNFNIAYDITIDGVKYDISATMAY
jgi:hypothetical protein